MWVVGEAVAGRWSGQGKPRRVAELFPWDAEIRVCAVIYSFCLVDCVACGGARCSCRGCPDGRALGVVLVRAIAGECCPDCTLHAALPAAAFVSRCLQRSAIPQPSQSPRLSAAMAPPLPLPTLTALLLESVARWVPLGPPRPKFTRLGCPLRRVGHAHRRTVIAAVVCHSLPPSRPLPCPRAAQVSPRKHCFQTPASRLPTASTLPSPASALRGGQMQQASMEPLLALTQHRGDKR